MTIVATGIDLATAGDAYLCSLLVLGARAVLTKGESFKPPA